MVDRCDYKIGECIDNRYTVSKVLGEGSFGKVYRVKDYEGHDYALKLLRLWEVPPEIRKPLMARFEMEFRTGQIDCEYLVRSLDYGVVGGNPYKPLPILINLVHQTARQFGIGREQPSVLPPCLHRHHATNHEQKYR